MCSAAASVSLKRGREAAVLGRVLGVARHRQQRLPGRVGGRVGVAVLVGVPDRRDRPPELVEELRVEAGDPRVGRDDLAHREQVRGVDEIHAVLRRRRSASSGCTG